MVSPSLRDETWFDSSQYAFASERSGFVPITTFQGPFSPAVVRHRRTSGGEMRHLFARSLP